MIQLPHAFLIVIGSLFCISVIMCMIIFIATRHERRRIRSSSSSIASSFVSKMSMYDQILPKFTWNNDEESFEHVILQSINQPRENNRDTKNNHSSKETNTTNQFIDYPLELNEDKIHRISCIHIAPTPNRSSPILHFDAHMNNNEVPWIVTPGYRIILKENLSIHQFHEDSQRMNRSSRSKYELSSMA